MSISTANPTKRFDTVAHPVSRILSLSVSLFPAASLHHRLPLYPVTKSASAGAKVTFYEAFGVSDRRRAFLHSGRRAHLTTNPIQSKTCLKHVLQRTLHNLIDLLGNKSLPRGHHDAGFAAVLYDC